MLARLAKDEPEKYATFWKEFGAVLKEGVAEDPANQAAILPLLRFASTREAHDNPTREPRRVRRAHATRPGAHLLHHRRERRGGARAALHIELLRQRGIEVLLLADRIDEWVMGQVEDFEGKRFKDAARGDLELGRACERGRQDARTTRSSRRARGCSSASRTRSASR